MTEERKGPQTPFVRRTFLTRRPDIVDDAFVSTAVIPPGPGAEDVWVDVGLNVQDATGSTATLRWQFLLWNAESAAPALEGLLALREEVDVLIRNIARLTDMGPTQAVETAAVVEKLK